MAAKRNPTPSARGTVAIVGAGGNIGSHVVPHVARMPGVSRLILVDRDGYESKNLRSQDITPRDVGASKAEVMARRVQEIAPEKEVVAIADDIRNVPLGLLRSVAIVACLDSKVARKAVNQAAFRLGTPWIDAGVQAEGFLARVNVCIPSMDAPCLECAWDDQVYATLEQVHPCLGKEAPAAPTNAPSALGALAAALQAIELEKLLAGRIDELAAGREVLVDARFHKHYVTTYRRNPACRFNHEVWTIEGAMSHPREATIGSVLGRGRRAAGRAGLLTLSVEGRPFVTALQCMGECGERRQALRLAGRLTRSQQACRRCGGEMVPIGFEMADRLGDELLTPSVLRRSLASVGFRPGDVYTAHGPRSERHYLLA